MAEHPQATATRIDRVREILDDASGEVCASYNGLGTFWHLPRRELLALKLYGIRMFAPEYEPVADTEPEPKAAEAERAAPSCCGSKPAPATAGPTPAPVETAIAGGRGAASGLIRGLRGRYPFDGTSFPPLPWGGRRLTNEEIDFIEAWIDDGCPEEDYGVTLKAVLSPEAAAAADTEPREYRLFALPTSEFKHRAGELRQRVNLACMDPVDVEKLRHAHRELYDLNEWPQDKRNYNNLALIHQNHCQHAWERFLPWHRVYLNEFEKALRRVCPDVTLPYWDWTLPIYANGKYLTEGDFHERGGQIPEAYRAYLTQESLDNLRCTLTADQVDALERLRGLRYTSLNLFFAAVDECIGEQARIQNRDALIYELLRSNALWYPLRYPAEFHKPDGAPSTINDIIHYHYPSAADVRQIQSLSNYRDYGGGSIYNDSYGYIDQNPHNTIHIWSGGQNPAFPKAAERGVRVKRKYHTREDLFEQPEFGDMFSNLTASFDPIFWPHHVNIDRLWSEWQVEHPHSKPVDLDAALTPWNYTVKDVLEMDAFGYEYVKGCFVFPVDAGSPIARFVSQRASIPPVVLQTPGRVELRLHRVPQLPLSCYVRAFLNLPDASAASRIEDNPHYAGYLAVFGHGPCYGGPGHCDAPELDERKADQRNRDHNAPRNHRIDVTECVAGLVRDGATELQVTLVVVGVDGRELPGLLRLEGVSLNFKD